MSVPKLHLLISGFVVGLLATVCVPKAIASCGYSGKPTAGIMIPQSWPEASDSVASLMLVANQQGADDRIVGFWKMTLVAEGNAGIPNGTVIDAGYTQWHGDGTEIINSSRPPATGNFCLGVWQKSGPSGYTVNHIALAANENGQLIGPAQIRENVALDQKANHYDGTFTLDQYDFSGNLLAHIGGRVTATRITVNTTIDEIL